MFDVLWSIIVDKRSDLKTLCNKFKNLPQQFYTQLKGYVCDTKHVSHQKTFQGVYTLYKPLTG